MADPIPAAEATHRFCEDCAWFRRAGQHKDDDAQLRFATCARASRPVTSDSDRFVARRFTPQPDYCSSQRGLDGEHRCGPSAQFFEPRELQDAAE